MKYSANVIRLSPAEIAAWKAQTAKWKADLVACKIQFGENATTVSGSCIQWHGKPHEIESFTRRNIEQAYDYVVGQGYVPKDYHLVVQPSVPGEADISSATKTIRISSDDMLWRNAETTKAVILHEAGHLHVPKPVYDIGHTADFNALLLPAALLAYGCYISGGGVAKGIARHWPETNRPKLRKTLRRLAGLSLRTALIGGIAITEAYMVNGHKIYKQRHADELAADAFAISAMRDARPHQRENIIDSQNRNIDPFAETSFVDEIIKAASFYRNITGDEKDDSSVRNVIRYGIWFYDTHPSSAERIAAAGKLARAHGWPAFTGEQLRKEIKYRPQYSDEINEPIAWRYRDPVEDERQYREYQAYLQTPAGKAMLKEQDAAENRFRAAYRCGKNRKKSCGSVKAVKL